MDMNVPHANGVKQANPGCSEVREAEAAKPWDCVLQPDEILKGCYKVRSEMNLGSVSWAAPTNSQRARTEPRPSGSRSRDAYQPHVPRSTRNARSRGCTQRGHSKQRANPRRPGRRHELISSESRIQATPAHLLTRVARNTPRHRPRAMRYRAHGSHATWAICRNSRAAISPDTTNADAWRLCCWTGEIVEASNAQVDHCGRRSVHTRRRRRNAAETTSRRQIRVARNRHADRRSLRSRPLPFRRRDSVIRGPKSDAASARPINKSPLHGNVI